jgi:hypothetical protein
MQSEGQAARGRSHMREIRYSTMCDGDNSNVPTEQKYEIRFQRGYVQTSNAKNEHDEGFLVSWFVTVQAEHTVL